MRKTICSGIITFGILVSLSSCYAFDYRSEEAGFSVDVPDDKTIIVSKDLFAAGSNKSGMHGIAAISLLKNIRKQLLLPINLKVI